MYVCFVVSYVLLHLDSWCRHQFHLTTKFIFKCKKSLLFQHFWLFKFGLLYRAQHHFKSEVSLHAAEWLLRLAVMDPRHLHGTFEGSQPRYHRFLMLLTIHSRPWYNLQQRKSFEYVNYSPQKALIKNKKPPSHPSYPLTGGVSEKIENVTQARKNDWSYSLALHLKLARQNTWKLPNIKIIAILFMQEKHKFSLGSKLKSKITNIAAHLNILVYSYDTTGFLFRCHSFLTSLKNAPKHLPILGWKFHAF